MTVVARIVTLILSLLMAAVGTALVLLYVQRLDDRIRDDVRAEYADRLAVSAVFVATAEIGAGTSLDDAVADGSLVADPGAPAWAEGVGALTATDVAEKKGAGLVLAVPVPVGSVLVGSMLTQGGPPASEGDATVAVTTEEASRSAGLIKAGERVAILLTTPAGPNNVVDTCVVAPSVLVVDGGSPVAAGGAVVPAGQVVAPIGPDVFTLAVSDDLALQLATARDTGRLTYVPLTAKASKGAFSQRSCPSGLPLAE